MERNKATAKPVAWPSCAWLQLSFSPFPVGHPMFAGCIGTTQYCTAFGYLVTWHFLHCLGFLNTPYLPSVEVWWDSWRSARWCISPCRWSYSSEWRRRHTSPISCPWCSEGSGWQLNGKKLAWVLAWKRAWDSILILWHVQTTHFLTSLQSFLYHPSWDFVMFCFGSSPALLGQ